MLDYLLSVADANQNDPFFQMFKQDLPKLYEQNPELIDKLFSAQN
jgi:hypothetical protein